jgi:hypothetical protein
MVDSPGNTFSLSPPGFCFLECQKKQKGLIDFMSDGHQIEELAWQAGMVDGEGCLTISKQVRNGRPSPAFRVSITVSNTNRALLDPFKEMWGGNIYPRPERRVAKKWSDAWTWHCFDYNQKSFLETILPFLKGKRTQAKHLLDFISHKHSFRRYHGSPRGGSRGGSAPLGEKELEYRIAVWNLVRRLNRKGQYSRSRIGGAL